MPNGLGYWNTWSQVGGCLGKFRKCGFVRESRSGGCALRFQKPCPILGEYTWLLFVVPDVALSCWSTCLQHAPSALPPRK